MKNQDLLTEVANQFKIWRTTRTNAVEKTPLILRQQTVALRAHYSQKIIMSTLKISGSNLKNWSQAETSEGETPAFIALEAPELPQKTKDNKLNLTLDFANGCKLPLAGDISAQLLRALTSGVLS